MTDSHHDSLSEIFLTASDLADEERASYLDEACDGDPELRDTVERMLATLHESPNGLSRAATEIDLSAFDGSSEDPEVIGPYRIVRRLDAGGMGIVYEARQEQPERSIALKVLRWVDDPMQIARFELEAEVLGWLRHPAIAHVYGAGRSSLPGGARPWIAMELVNGETIDRHVQRIRPAVEDVLRLIVRVLEGVSHAHAQGVVHRDLKPANIIVDDEGQPKIIDFGVAQTSRAGDVTAYTRDGDIVGTLAYMSPEQVRADRAQIGTRSDVYSIGAVAYELLSGERAVVAKGSDTSEAMRCVLDVDPKPLSSRVDIPTEVSTIVHTALEKEPERRYATADAFAQDIRRFLAHEPIAARPPSALYQLRKLGRRHLGATVGLALAVAALIAGAVTSTLLYLEQRRIAEERNDALSAAKEAAAESERQLGLSTRAVTYYGGLISSGGVEGDGREAKLTDILDRATLAVPEEFADAPEHQARILLSFATARYNGQQLDEAAALADQIITLGETHSDVSREVRASALMLRSSVLTLQQKPEEAEGAATLAIKIQQDPENDEMAEKLAKCYSRRSTTRRDQNDFDGARDDLTKALEVIEGRVLSKGFRGGLLQSLSQLEFVQGHPEEAIRLGLESLESLEDDGVGDSQDACHARVGLGLALVRSQNAVQGREVLRKAAEYEEAHNGMTDLLSVILRGIAQSHSIEGDYAGAEEHLMKAKSGLEETGSLPSVEMAMVLTRLGANHEAQGDLQSAKDTYRAVSHALEGCSSFVCQLRLAQSVDMVARVYGLEGDWENSRATSLEALELLEPIEGADQMDRVKAHFESHLAAAEEHLKTQAD